MEQPDHYETANNTNMKTITIRQVSAKAPFKHVAHHRFPFPGAGEIGFYKVATSFNAFFNGKHRSNRRPDGFLFTEVREEDAPHRSEWELQRDAALPVHEHASIWDFYDAIGFDRRIRKYYNFEPSIEPGPWTK